MSVNLYRWTEECDGKPCVGDCDKCKYVFVDLISRQAAIAEFSCCELTPDGGIDANYAIDFLEQMPSAHCTDCPLKGVNVKLP